MSKGPVLFDLDDAAKAPLVADAPPVPDADTLPQGLPEPRAMQTVAVLAGRRPSRLAQLFWGLAGAVLAAVLSAAAWNFVTGWIAAAPIVGWVFAGLIGAFVLVLLVVALRELAALSRLRRIDDLRHGADQATEQQDLAQARQVTQRLLRLYAGREDTRWQRERFAELEGDQLDAQGLLSLAEHELLGPLDAAAIREVEAAASSGPSNSCSARLKSPCASS